MARNVKASVIHALADEPEVTWRDLLHSAFGELTDELVEFAPEDGLQSAEHRALALLLFELAGMV